MTSGTRATPATACLLTMRCATRPIATELDRIEAAPPLERMLVTKPPIKGWATLVSRQKDPSIKTRRQAALTAMLRVVDRLPARGPSQGAAYPSSLTVGTFHAPG